MADKENNDVGIEFDQTQILFASFELLMQNTAMLRLLMHNQDRIMKRLLIKPEVPKALYEDLDLFMAKGKKSPRSADHIEKATRLITERIWEWVNLKLDINPGKDKPKKK